MTEMAALQAFVHGHVQGVFFRATVETWAAELNLNGYVRNRSGGIVEVAVEGEKPQLEKLVGYLKVGPPAARVDDVKCYWMDYKEKFTSFSIR